MTAPFTPLQQFLPRTQVPLEAARVPLDALPPDGALGCDPPDPALVADIAVVGVLQPVLLMRQATGVYGAYVVCDGRGRIRAARAAGCTDIPALVAPLGHIAPSALGSKANALRRENPRTRLAFIEEATAAGLDDRAICRVGGFGAAELRAARRLQGLIPALRAALDAGTIRASVAHAATALTPEQQQVVACQLAKTGQVHVSDVRAARRVARTDAVAALPPALFDTPPVEPAGDWQAEIGQLLRHALALVPADAPALHGAIAAALAAVRAEAEAADVDVESAA